MLGYPPLHIALLSTCLWIEPLSVTINWKAVEQYFTVVLFVFQFYSVCDFGKFISFGLGTIRSERVKNSTPPYEAILFVCSEIAVLYSTGSFSLEDMELLPTLNRLIHTKDTLLSILSNNSG